MLHWGTRISGRVALTLLAASAFQLSAMAEQTPALTVPAAAAASVVLSSPLDYQVFQRATKLRGTIWINGRSAGAG